ncbi:hypothetical protein ACFSR7_01290 [Cohnella sp. GCM10020058]|uniref:hypothetical protein n=1 Tax=Cohnella sp. GCM10020058 TaxID=3317330 RepID=UPI00362DCB62
MPRPETLQGFKDDWNGFVKQSGIRKRTWFIKNGKGTDGTPYDLAGRYDRNEIDKMAIKNLADSVYDNDAYENPGPQGGTPEALTMQKVQDLMTQSVTKVIIAKSEADAYAAYDKMLSDMKSAGSDKVEKLINDNYQERQPVRRRQPRAASTLCSDGGTALYADGADRFTRDVRGGIPRAVSVWRGSHGRHARRRRVRARVRRRRIGRVSARCPCFLCSIPQYG